MNRKEQRREQNARLLQEAQRSEVDPKTGRIRCLSCGNVFKSFHALAAHLQKHNGINSVDFQQTKIVGTSQQGRIQTPCSRPSNTISFEALIQQSYSTFASKKSHSQQVKAGLSHRKPAVSKEQKTLCEEDHSRRKPRLTPTKRLILISRVLSLTESLSEIKDSLKLLEKDSISTTKERKRMKGIEKSTSLELHHALVAMNQKLSFRQIILLEFLINGTSTLEPAVSSVGASDQVEADSKTLDLYREVDCLAEKMEVERCDENQPLFIKKPSLSADQPVPFVPIPIHPLTVYNPADTDEIREEGKEQEQTHDNAESSSDSSSDDGDDELLGFGDVLSQWAKNAQHKRKCEVQEKQPCLSLAKHIDVHPEEKMTESISPVNKTVHIVHVKKSPEEPESTEEEIESQGPQTLFIRPHLSEESPQKAPQEKKSNPEAKEVETKEPGTRDEKIVALLRRLSELQQEHMKTSDSKKWLISGFSEVKKALKREPLELIVIATNLDALLEDKIMQIQTKAQEKKVPVIRALTRRKIGQVYHPRKRMAVVGILNSQDSQPHVQTILDMSVD